jgi:hypothetical protein
MPDAGYSVSTQSGGWVAGGLGVAGGCGFDAVGWLVTQPQDAVHAGPDRSWVWVSSR